MNTNLKTGLIAFLIHLVSIGMLQAQNTPTVNGLFYGDGDNNRYPSTPYAVSEGGSKLYLTLQNGTLYVALVIDRSVNDNVFDGHGGSGKTPYMDSAGWLNQHRGANRLYGSEFAEFILKLGTGSSQTEYSWKHGYASDSDGDNNRTEADWISGVNASGGVGPAPPGLTTASSLQWNLNKYASDGATWMSGTNTSPSSWKSPFHPSFPNDITKVDGYPSGGQITYSNNFEWEWSMVYEWSLDFTALGVGSTPVFVLTGDSHHSPIKNHDSGCDTDDDCFPTSDPDPLYDFGDLPDSYNTLLSNSGARHIIDPNGAYLGENLDSDSDGMPGSEADGDDTSGIDDEDGITFLTPFVPGGTAKIKVVVGEDGYLSAFIDFDSDGTLETVTLDGGGSLSDHFLSAGAHTLEINVPSDATGLMYARFRITNNENEGGDSPAGEAESGEVEDYNSLAALGDYAWQDYDNDGIQDSDEPGLKGVVVNLLDGDGDPVLDADNNPLTTTTDNNGFYEFPGLLPGSYQVEFEEPESFEFTDRNQGSNDGKDSDANTSTGKTQVVSLSPGEINNTLDAGFVENLTLVLTVQQCYRTLSSPFKNKTYHDLIGSLWTQGVVGSDMVGAGLSESNIFVWSNSEPDKDAAGWIAPGGTNGLNDGIPAGSGFLMSIFEDDNGDGTVEPHEEFPKEITMTGEQYGANDTVSPAMNGNPDGWTLVGNPFGDDIDFHHMVNNNLTTDLTDVAYVYNINAGGSTPDAEGNPIPGGWMTTDGSLGDIPDGKIAVFQGFFVQTDGNDPAIEFTNEARTTGATFYGKENKQKKDHVRLQLESKSLYNSAWLSFSENGNSYRMKGDAYELEPFSENYVLMGTRKGDELFDIAQFPDQPGSEMNLHIETTTAGSYTLTATDLQLSEGKKLLFTDTQENITLSLDDSFEYQFTIGQTAKKNNNLIDPLTCGTAGQSIADDYFTPKKAKINSSTGDRFIITLADASQHEVELPVSVSLNQNYPNPFNPTTQISYELPKQSDVRLEVYDLVGRQVATLVNQTMEAGSHTVNFNAGNLSSGVYIYRLNAGNTVLSRKLTVIK